jgi:voltage-gated potassium channel Kch
MDAVADVTHTPLRIIAGCATALALIARAADAHPIHTTLTVLTPDAGGRGVTLTIRAFADDLSASVARFAGRAAPRDSSMLADEVARYVRGRVRVLDAAGVEATLAPCGVRRARELYWLCFHVALPAGMRGARIGNQLLTDLHSDQVNILQLELVPGRGRKSYLFTPGSPAVVLAP